MNVQLLVMFKLFKQELFNTILRFYALFMAFHQAHLLRFLIFIMEAILEIPLSDNIHYRLAGSVDQEPRIKQAACCFKTAKSEQASFFYKGRPCMLEMTEGKKIRSCITGVEENEGFFLIHVKPENRSR